MDLHDKLILITGASGFIGGHLAERLARDESACVRALVRAPVETLHATSLRGDVTNVDAVARAVEGCDAVIHCAAMQGTRGRLDDFRRVNVNGTLNLLRAARDAKVARFIHISTINVHGVPPPPNANADSPLKFKGDFYSVSKSEGERAAWQFARDAARNLPLVVVRPACTYGPRSGAWTLQPLRRVQRGAPVLIGSGNGICNAIYIDNLIDLIVLAMKNDAAVGQAFVGAEGRGVTWREFYGAYARMAGVARLRSMPRLAGLAIATVAEAATRLDGRAPLVSRASVEFYSHRVVFDISKAEKLLGYTPRISFEEGMRRTEEWLKAEGKIQNPKSQRDFQSEIRNYDASTDCSY